ncbi:MAG: acetolactate synthase [Euryarchaeota archaeon]|nr:acetolactate synthase [Euryarchaeota archaeon]
MEVVSMVVNDEFGVMQRIVGEFTRRKINIETIVVGKCEIPGKARVVLGVNDRADAESSVSALKQRVHDIISIEILDPSRHEAYALISNTNGKARLIGSTEEVDALIDAYKPEKFVKAINAI